MFNTVSRITPPTFAETGNFNDVLPRASVNFASPTLTPRQLAWIRIGRAESVRTLNAIASFAPNTPRPVSSTGRPLTTAGNSGAFVTSTG